MPQALTINLHPHAWWLIIGLLVSLAPATDVRANQAVGYRLETIAEGLSTPWGLAFIDHQQLLISERPGTAKLLNLTTGKMVSISGLPLVVSEGQGGLLDIAISPHFGSDSYIYLTYSKPAKNKGVTTLARAKLVGNQFKQWQDLLVTRSDTQTTRHYGSRIAFDDAGHVFFSVGDRGERANGQNLQTHAGSILRLNLDGSVPQENPFVGTEGALPEIWSYGHRNPQGLAYDKTHQRLWAIEHGPRGGDEINLIQPGHNYGWPVVSHGKEYWGPFDVGEATHKAGMDDPIKVYIPSIAPGSLLLYKGAAFPQWQGNLFAGALAMRHLNRIEISAANATAAAEERLLEDMQERIRAVIEGPDGFIYCSTDSGKILRLVPNS